MGPFGVEEGAYNFGALSGARGGSQMEATQGVRIERRRLGVLGECEAGRAITQ